jgi:copper chaperone NosL
MVRSELLKSSRILLLLSGVLLLFIIKTPIWRIELNAPQYPEGLALQIHADGIKGDVEIINGLNHYIGMKTLHNKDFFEFTALPYLIGAFAGLFILAAVVNKKSALIFGLSSFVVFGIVAMVDFWRWEYNYGHDLNPDAAIKVPGMAYQPPLIGYKQLLNFGAYSIPDIGGWLFIAIGIIVLSITFIELKRK